MTANKVIQEFKKKCPNSVTHIRQVEVDNPLINPPLMSSPTPSTIEDVIHSSTLSPHEYSLAAPLTITNLSKCSNTSLILLSPLTQMTLLLLQSPSPVDWMMMNQLLYGHLLPPTLCGTLSTCPTIPLCRPVTQRYTYATPLEDSTVWSSINHAVWSAVPSERNLEDPPTNASASRRQKLKIAKNLSMSHWKMRPSTIWGQYLCT